MTTVSRQWVLKARPTGMVGPEHFELREETLPEPGDGELLVRTLLLSLDPANRAWMAPTPTYKAPVMPGDVMHGFALGEVVRSNAAGFAPGDLVDGMIGWRNHAVVPAADMVRRDRRHRPEHLMGVLGVTGLTAYFGLLDIGQPKSGETVLVSAAAGAVGSIVGQIAKLKGCRVVGTAGGSEKCAWLTREMGFDAAVDYKAGNVRRALREACPDGVDVYFDNAGGEVLNVALFLMNTRGRIVCCGNVSQYNAETIAPGPAAVPGLLVVKRLRMEGFIVLDYEDRRAEAEAVLAGWLADGSLKSAEDIVEGLDQAPAALAGLFAGRNRGKLLIRVA